MKIEYDFVKMGSVVTPREGHLFLDVGNRLGNGIIDTHAESNPSAATACSSSLIVEDPSLVTGWVLPSEPMPRIVLHEKPDFDCVAASLLASRLLEARADGKPAPEQWRLWAPLLAAAAVRIDQGKTRVALPAHGERAGVTPYLALLVLDDLASRRGLSNKDAWKWVVEQGHRLLDRAIRLAIESGAQLDAVDLRGKLGDLRELEERVDERIAAFASDAARIGLHGSRSQDASNLDGIEELELPDRCEPGLSHLARMAFILDPACGGGFFKSLMRGAFHDEIQATCVFYSIPPDPMTGAAEWVRAVISVDPDTPYDLRGLGRLLEQEETRARVDAGMPRVGAPRPGYDNPDPWYDGRAHTYTIIDAPRWGTILAPKQVKTLVLSWQRWRRLRLYELVESAPETLRSFHASDDERRHALRTLAAFATGATWDETTHPDRRMAAAALELAEAVTAADVPLLSEIMTSPALLAVCATSDQPRVRAWALNGAAAAAEATIAVAESIGRKDLVTAIRLAAKTDGAKVADIVHGVSVERLESRHRLLIDAAVSLASRGGAMLVAPLHGLLSAAADCHAFRSSVIELARHAGSDVALMTVCRRALANVTEDLRRVNTAADTIRHHWPSLSQAAAAAIQIDAFTNAEREAVAEALAAARERVLAALSSNAAEWFRSLEQGTPIDRVCTSSRALAAAKFDDDVAIALLMLLADLPEAVRGKQKPEYAEALRTEILRVARALLESVLEGPHDGRLRSDLERSAIAAAVRGVARLVGLEPLLVHVSHLPAAATRALYARAPWLLCAAAPIIPDNARRAAIDVAMSSEGTTTLTAAVEAVGTQSSEELMRHALELARAADVVRRLPNSAPSYAVSVIAFHILPLVARRQTMSSGNQELKKALDLTMRLAAHPPLTFASDPAMKAQVRRDVATLLGILESDLQHTIAYRTILGHFECSLARLNVLLRACDVIGVLSAKSAQFAVKVMEWVAALPNQNGCEALQTILAIRDEVLDKELDYNAIFWCGQVLDPVIDCFRKDERDALTAADVHTALREIRLRRTSCPDSGLAYLLSLALDDVVGYLQKRREVCELLEGEAHLRRTDTKKLTNEALEVSTAAWLQAELRSSASEEERRGIIDFYAAVEASAHDMPEEKSEAYYAEVRHLLGRKERPLIAPAASSAPTSAPSGEITDRAYRRHHLFMQLDGVTIDRLIDCLISRALARYALKDARRLIDDHSLAPPSLGFRLWFSGAILLLPLAFLVVFVAHERWETRREALSLVAEIGLVASFAACMVPFLIEGWRGKRLRNYVRRIPAGTLAGSIERLQKRKRQLFLPQFLVPVMVGVYSVVLTDEVGVKVAAKIHDGPLLLLVFGFAVASMVVLAQLIQRGGGRFNVSNLFTAGAKIFTYAFLIAIMLSIIVAPLIRHELDEAEDERMSNFVFLHLPHDVATPHFGHVIEAVYPRHIVLYAMLGMFVGIFLHGFLHVKDEKVEPV